MGGSCTVSDNSEIPLDNGCEGPRFVVMRLSTGYAREDQSMNMQEIVESTRATVAERPYTTYDRGSLPYCTYLEGKCSDDSVGCLLGQVLTGLGVSPDMLFRNTGIAMFLGRDLHLVDTDDDRQAVKWCSLVQLLQDKGDRWSSAIAAAESKYPCAY